MPARQPATGTPTPTPDNGAAKDAEVLKGVEVTPTTDTTNGSPRRSRRNRREGPRAEVEFLIAVRDALKAGVETEMLLPVLNFAVKANGAAAWRMVTEALTELTLDAEDDEDADES